MSASVTTQSRDRGKPGRQKRVNAKIIAASPDAILGLEPEAAMAAIEERQKAVGGAIMALPDPDQFIASLTAPERTALEPVDHTNASRNHRRSIALLLAGITGQINRVTKEEEARNARAQSLEGRRRKVLQVKGVQVPKGILELVNEPIFPTSDLMAVEKALAEIERLIAARSGLVGYGALSAKAMGRLNSTATSGTRRPAGTRRPKKAPAPTTGYGKSFAATDGGQPVNVLTGPAAKAVLSNQPNAQPAGPSKHGIAVPHTSKKKGNKK